MSLYYLRWQRQDDTWVDEDGIHSALESAQQRAAHIAEVRERPVQIIDDWYGSVVETVEQPGGEGE
jgi:hypothetical protein